ncbi:hypothetical protein BX667DRAFT_493270, partial [Coemansia mojavensis]
MLSACQFQTLPWPVIGGIVHALAFSYDMDDCDAKSTVYGLLPLSHTCTQLRDAVFHKLKLSYSVSIYVGRLEANYMPKFYTCTAGGVNPQLNSYVKHVRYDFSYKNVVNGLGIEQLHVFPAATAISVVLNGIDDYNAESSSDACYLKQLAACIKQQVPAASKATLEMGFKHSCGAFDYTAINSFASMLFGNVEERELQIRSSNIPKPLDGNLAVHTLCSIYCVWDVNYHLLAQAIKNSAATLNSITLNCFHLKGLEQLFYYDSKRPVTYPVAEAVAISSPSKEPAPLIQANATAVFPSLKKLAISCTYPFANDIMFYGNYGSLNYLSVDLDYNFLRLFSSGSDLANKRLERLQALILYSRSQGLGDYDVENSELYNLVKYTQFVERLTIYNSTIPLKVIQLLDSKAKYVNVKQLCIYKTDITLSDAIKMLQGMPALQALRSRISGVGSQFEGLHAKQLVKHMLDKYPMLHKSFSAWEIYNDTPLLTNEFTKTIICLANVCPYFSKIMFRTYIKREIGRLLLELVTSKVYLHCKSRLYVTIASKFEYYWQII